MEKEEIIQTHKYYSMLMIYKLGLFGWIDSYDAVKRLILNDINNNKNKTFKAVIYGNKNGKRYLIKGSTLVSLLKKVKKGYKFNGE